MADSPEDIIRRVNARWPHQFPDEVEPEIIDPLAHRLWDNEGWVLVERSNITGGYALSIHRTLTQAIEYQARQECAEDWEPRVCVSLVTGLVTELQRTYSADAEDTGEAVDAYADWRR